MSSLKEAHHDGLTILLTGLRPGLDSALQRMGIAKRRGEKLIIGEEKEQPGTLAAVRNAYEPPANRLQEPTARAPVYYVA